MNGTDSTKLPKLAGAGIPLAPTGDTDLGDEDRIRAQGALPEFILTLAPRPHLPNYPISNGPDHTPHQSA
jgi:hypothetical protein